MKFNSPEYIVKIIENKDINLITKIVNNNDFSQKDKCGIPLFETLCVELPNQLELIKMVLKFNSITNKIKYASLLATYNKYGKTKITDYLFEITKYDLNLYLRIKGHNIFHMAVIKNDFDRVKKLVKIRKALMNTSNHEIYDALHLAIKNNCDINMVKYLYSSGIETHYHTIYESYHILASKYNRIDVIKYLLENEYNFRWIAGLTNAVTYGYFDIVKLYLDKQTLDEKYLEEYHPIFKGLSKFNTKNVINSVIGLAIKSKHFNIADYIINKNPNLIKGTEWNNIFRIVIPANNIDMIKYMLDKGCDINVKNNTGYTPIMIASVEKYGITDNFKMMRYLIHRGCDINILNNDRTILEVFCNPFFKHELIDKKYESVINILVNAGCKKIVPSNPTLKKYIEDAFIKKIRLFQQCINYIAKNRKIFPDKILKILPRDIKNYFDFDFL